MYSANYTLFRTGDIITETQCAEKWDLWFGYPETMIDTFVQSSNIDDANNYLESKSIPWRVSATAVVGDIRQWTIA